MELTKEARLIYQKLLGELEEFGRVTVEEKKISIHLKNRAGFAGVHPRKSYFILNIVSSTPIKSDKVIRQEQVSKSRYHNEVRIAKPEDIDSELLSWLKNAYILMS